MYLKLQKQIHAKFNISNDREIKSTRNLIQLRYNENECGERMNSEES